MNNHVKLLRCSLGWKIKVWNFHHMWSKLEHIFLYWSTGDQFERLIEMSVANDGISTQRFLNKESNWAAFIIAICCWPLISDSVSALHKCTHGSRIPCLESLIGRKLCKYSNNQCWNAQTPKFKLALPVSNCLAFSFARKWVSHYWQDFIYGLACCSP